MDSECSGLQVVSHMDPFFYHNLSSGDMILNVPS